MRERGQKSLAQCVKPHNVLANARWGAGRGFQYHDLVVGVAGSKGRSGPADDLCPQDEDALSADAAESNGRKGPVDDLGPPLQDEDEQ